MLQVMLLTYISGCLFPFAFCAPACPRSHMHFSFLLCRFFKGIRFIRIQLSLHTPCLYFCFHRCKPCDLALVCYQPPIPHHIHPLHISHFALPHSLALPCEPCTVSLPVILLLFVTSRLTTSSLHNSFATISLPLFATIDLPGRIKPSPITSMDLKSSLFIADTS